ncbi:armadillo-type protein [Cokeromyces recurvatus]|uniref:armadillo-type protein n=1 Tax=Cokeromyces recurvatus TaxID=90255 RepID=UPI00221E9014|nr:armadillo-type protein [Cokeromyces recurvatus]KAI7902962.1 armadillo-type protein [Cokeromyces recurvatus]
MKDNSIPLELNTGQGTNRFKYQSFKTRVERIKVDVVRRSRIVEDEPDYHGSFFYEALLQWKDLNLTRHFKDFLKEITPLVKSLPSIIYHKETIITIFEKHLQVNESMALDGILDLITKLAKDLEGEFYPYYTRLLSRILPLVYQKDIKLLESVFNCIAYLFKFLSRQILPDLEQTFNLFTSLLGEDNQTRPYIRHFTAEAFAYLLRKTRGADLKKIVQYILNTLKAEPSQEFEEGLAMLFFESIKQIDHRIHSRGESIYKELLIQSYNNNEDIKADDLPSDPIHSLLKKTTLLVLHHVYRQHFTPMINIVLNELDTELKEEVPNEKKVAIQISILNMIVTVRKGSRVEDFKPIVSHLQEAAKYVFNPSQQHANYLYTETVRLIAGTLFHGSLEVVISGGRVILDILHSCNVDFIYGFYLSLAKLKWPNYTQVCLPYIVKYASDRFDEYPYETILFLAEVFNEIELESETLTSSLTAEGLVRFPTLESKKPFVESVLDIMSKTFDWTKERDILNTTDLKAKESNISAITVLASALRILTKIQTSVDKVSPVIMSLFISLADFLQKNNEDDNSIVNTPYILGHKNYVLESLMGLALESLTSIASHSTSLLGELNKMHERLMKGILINYKGNELILSGIYQYLDLLYSSNNYKEVFSLENFGIIYNHLKDNLSSYRHQCRLNTLKILALYDQPMMKLDDQHKTLEPSELVRTALHMEEINATFKEYRDKVLLIQKLNLITSSKRTPDLLEDFAPRLALGLLTVNLRPLWVEARKILVTFSNNNAELYWSMMHDELMKFNHEYQLVRDGFSKDILDKLIMTNDMNESHQKATKTGNITFECPTLTHITHVQDQSWKIMQTEKAQSLALLFAGFSQQEDGHMDFWNYYNLLLLVLKDTATTTEAKGRHLVPIFLKFYSEEFMSTSEEGEEENEDDNEADQAIMINEELGILQRSSRVNKSRMTSWLAIFAVYKNPAAAYRTAELYDVFMHIIAMGDFNLQKAALECIISWKNPNVKPYADNLRLLYDDTRFRDELSNLIQNEEQSPIDPAHRKGLMPVLMRILYGRLIQRAKASAKTSKTARRKMILGSVACCTAEEIRYFIDLALEPFKMILELPGMEVDQDNHVSKFEFVSEGKRLVEQIPWRKQTGLLNLLEDMIKQLATYILPFAPDLLKVVLYLINFVHSRRLPDAMEVDGEKEQSSKSKEVRALAMKRIVGFFKISGNFDFTSFIPSLFSAYITPQLPAFPSTTSQDVSSLLNLFLVWSKQSKYANYLVDYDPSVIPQIIATLSVEKLNENVLNVLLEIIESLLDLCDNEMDVDGTQSLKEKLIIPHVNLLLNELKYRLTQSKDDAKFGNTYSIREIAIAARIAPYAKNGEQAATIVALLLPSLKKPSRVIPEKSKQDILTIWAKFIHIVPGFEAGSSLYHQYYNAASNFFAIAHSRETRMGLIEVFHTFAQANPDELTKVDELLTMMNSFSKKRIAEPDYDQMLDALSSIADTYYEQFNIHQWLPILHQLVYCMHNPDEMAVRGTATHCMVQFLKATQSQEDEEVKYKMIKYIEGLIYPAIKRGLRARIELVRMEFITLLGSCVKMFPELSMFEDMTSLLSNDEESNFFNNIYHMQISRRGRALQRLSTHAEENGLKIATVNHIFLPIIYAFLTEGDQIQDEGLLRQCTNAITALAKVLSWNSYYNLLQTYLKLVKQDNEKEKLYVRAVICILDSFHFDVQHIEISDETVKSIMGRQKLRINYLTNEDILKQAAKDAGELQEEEMNENEEAEEEKVVVRDQAERIHDILVTKLLPDLNSLLNHNKTRGSVIGRVPLALGITKLLCYLPEKSKRVNLPGLLTSVCQIIRSRAQDVRDVTRDTLVKISAFLGPAYFNFIIKDLRASLQKGYELHVLGFTVNSLIQDIMKQVKVGDLDYCLEDIVDVLVNDIFGTAGEEKDQDEMTGKTKEAKSRRSPISFELLSQVIHFKHVHVLLMPLKEVMSNTESNRKLLKVEDLLRRIAIGLVKNPEFESLELLDFAYNLITENKEEYKVQPKMTVKKTQKELNFEVQMKRPTAEPVDHYRANAYRFVFLGLSLLASALKKNKFDLTNEEYLLRLRKLVNAVGNTLYSNQSANVVLSARIMSQFIPMKIGNIQSAVGVSIDRCFAILKSSGTSRTKTVQACLKLLIVCIRDNTETRLTETQLTYILDFVRPDLEELERQSTTFGLIRAIISRKFVAPEMYDLMDNISNIMVTNQSKEVRQQARSVFFMFLMDYPQGKGRLKQQMTFVIKNLEYVFESGRESVMEFLYQIITKFGDEVLIDYIDPIFFALVMRLVNDESSKCREMAAALVKSLLARSTERLPTFYKLLNKWLDESGKPSLQRVACQVYGLALESIGTQLKPQAAGLIQRLSKILEESRDRTEELAADEEAMDVDIQWEVAYYAINTFAKIIKTFPKLVYEQSTEVVWRVMQYMLLFPHAWIRSSSTRLYGVFFSEIDPKTRTINESSTVCSYLDRATLRMLAGDFLEQLKSNHVTEEQADQIVKNLFFIGRCFYYMSDEEDEEEKDEEDLEDTDKMNDNEVVEGEDEAATEKINQKAHKQSLNWLFRKASFTARGAAIRKIKSDIILRSSVFKWFAAMCNTMTTEELPPYLMPVIAPIYRTVNEEQNKSDGFDSLQQLGTEILNLLQNKAGPTVYFAVYQRVRQQVLQTRQERKANKAVLAITNPTLIAKRKLDRKQKAYAKKKRAKHHQ